MKKKILYIILFCILLVGAMFYFSKKQKNTLPNFNRNYNESIILTKIDEYNFNEQLDRLHIYNNNIFFENVKKKSIKIYEKGLLKEIYNYSDLSDKVAENVYINNNSIYLSYPYKKGVFQVDLNTRIPKFIPLGVNFSRSIVIGDKAITKNCIEPKTCLNQEFSLIKNGKIQKRYDVIKHRKDGGLNQDGIFIFNDNHIIYLSYLLPDIFCFNIKGEYYKKISTVDKYDNEQEVRNLGNSVYSFKKMPVIHQRGAVVYNDKIYVLSAIKDAYSQKKNTEIMDVYDIEKGYVFSFYLPIKNNEIADFNIYNNILHIITYSNKYIQYDIEKI